MKRDIIAAILMMLGLLTAFQCSREADRAMMQQALSGKK